MFEHTGSFQQDEQSNNIHTEDCDGRCNEFPELNSQVHQTYEAEDSHATKIYKMKN